MRRHLDLRSAALTPIIEVVLGARAGRGEAAEAETRTYVVPKPFMSVSRATLRLTRVLEKREIWQCHLTVAQLALQNLDLTICAILSLSVPSRGSCDPAKWTGALGRWRGVPPSTRRGRSCLCASWVCTFVARRRRLDAAEIGDQALTGRTSLL